MWRTKTVEVESSFQQTSAHKDEAKMQTLSDKQKLRKLIVTLKKLLKYVL